MPGCYTRANTSIRLDSLHPAKRTIVGSVNTWRGMSTKLQLTNVFPTALLTLLLIASYRMRCQYDCGSILKIVKVNFTGTKVKSEFLHL
jgi:hypothetical protein